MFIKTTHSENNSPSTENPGNALAKYGCGLLSSLEDKNMKFSIIGGNVLEEGLIRMKLSDKRPELQ